MRVLGDLRKARAAVVAAEGVEGDEARQKVGLGVVDALVGRAALAIGPEAATVASSEARRAAFDAEVAKLKDQVAAGMAVPRAALAARARASAQFRGRK